MQPRILFLDFMLDDGWNRIHAIPDIGVPDFVTPL